MPLYRLLPRILRILSAVLIFGSGAISGLAEMPVFRLDTIFPPCGKGGTAVSLAVSVGDGLEAKELVFSHAGLSAEWKEKGRFEVKIAPEVAPGMYEVRAAGSLGFSNPRSFLVGVEEQQVPLKAGATPAEALELRRGVAIVGKATAASSDYFRMRLKEGERALLLCEARALDSRLVPVLELLDGAGQKIAVQPVKTASGSTLLDFRAPKEGEYLLRLHDLTFAGGSEYAYRLLLSPAPFVETASSLVLEAGGKRRVTLYGRQLPQGRPGTFKGLDGVLLEEVDVEVEAPERRPGRAEGPARASGFDVEGFFYRLPSSAGPSNPVFFALSPLAPVVEPLVAGGTGSAAETRVTAPAVVSGHFFPRNNVDTWSFEARKGEVWRLEVVSHRIGYGTNPFLWVQLNGNDVAEAWGPDADLGGPFLPLPVNDPTLKFEAKEDGVYQVRVRDLSGANNSNPAAAYFLYIRRENPDFRLLASVLPPPEIAAQVISAPYSAMLRPGGTLAVRVLALRKDGFTGDIELFAEGLPEGVSCVPTRILSGKNEGYLVLAAQEKLEGFCGAIRIAGKALLGGQTERREARCAVTRWASTNVNTIVLEDYLVKDFVLGLLPGEPSPLALTPKEEAVHEVVAGGKLEVPLRVIRRGEFKEALKIKTAGFPGVEQVKEVEANPKAEAVSVVLDTAALKLPKGSHTVYFTTLTKGKFRGKDVTSTFFSTPFAFEIK